MNLAEDPSVIMFAVGQALMVVGWLISLGNRVARLESSSKTEAQATREILQEIRALRKEVHDGAVAYAGLKATVDALVHELRDNK